jgi:ABC-type phosphonate transport system ATPase subunit
MTKAVNSYPGFQILIDDPSEDPALGFRDYAEAFAEIVCDSPPRFAIGIVGGWDSGKTTLMRAIQAADRLAPKSFPVGAEHVNYRHSPTPTRSE